MQKTFYQKFMEQLTLLSTIPEREQTGERKKWVAEEMAAWWDVFKEKDPETVIRSMKYWFANKKTFPIPIELKRIVESGGKERKPPTSTVPEISKEEAARLLTEGPPINNESNREWHTETFKLMHEKLDKKITLGQYEKTLQELNNKYN